MKTAIQKGTKRDYTCAWADEWYRSLCEKPETMPFSFTYENKEYKGFSADFFTLKTRKMDANKGKETQTLVFDFQDGVEISLILTHYFSHGVTEWTVWFENTADKNSGILAAPQTELVFDGGYPVLKGILGDHINQYSPYSVDLSGLSVDFSSDSGRATHINFPYFNLEYGDGGVMLAIGWAGTWDARFSSDGKRTTYTARSVNGLATYLKPGEKIRTALFVTAPYTERNEQYATNFWRSWFIEHNLPKADASGADLQPLSTCCLASDTGLPNSDGSISERYTTWKPSLEKMIAEDVKVDYRWLDAGWYVRPNGESEEVDWWGSVGTWELDPVKWPEKTFLASTDFARENGMKTLVWFEPERVTDPENLAKHFGYRTDWAIRVEGESTISNNIGDPECLAWTTGRICKMLRENRVEMYREDNNCNAATLWSHLDAQEGAGRSGITECKFIAGHYKMWDDIIACTLSYGGCGFVDSCASGGGRNDLESMRRGVPLLRSDSDRTSTALRLAMTTTFNKWIPFCGANTKEKKEQLALTGISDAYVWRASYLASLNVDSQFVQDPDQDFDMLRFGLKEWKKVAPFLLKEFYTLTPWHKELDTSDFTAYCFYDPEIEKGVMLAFRQENCARATLPVSLPFAKEGERYSLTDEDSGESHITDGKDELFFAAPRTARLLWIARV
ncbi:MAG: alpha-galactosidase [Clostridia bacterium]|nr:alpha-galactosidase [Clostridia bacterium]